MFTNQYRTVVIDLGIEMKLVNPPINLKVIYKMIKANRKNDEWKPQNNRTKI